MIEIHSQDRSVAEHVDFDELEATDPNGAQPTNLAGVAIAYAEPMRHRKTGERFVVTYGFSEAEYAATSDEPSNLPFDADHVARLEREEH